MCLADFINPEGEDWIGGFAVGIHGLERISSASGRTS
jgi:5-methyltetrahydrofolate--homocysteine methyltransferase